MESGAASARRFRAWALVLLGLMALHGYLKWTWGTLPELLWGCNVASFAIIAGLWTRTARMVGMAVLWHVAVGAPGWLVDVVRTGHTHWVSVLAHTLPAVAGVLLLRRTGLPRSAPWLAFALFLALVPLSRYLTPPHLNVNLAHQRLDFLERVCPGAWSYRLAFGAGMLAALLAWDAVLGRLLGRPDRLAE